MANLKVLVVDDEYLIRNLLKLRINWADYAMEIAGEASSAKEALDLMDELLPDIIFTDICMPFMDGIEFSRLVVEKYPYVKIVIITGHDEFEYAKSGIKLGIFDFLLKPINAEEIKKVAKSLQEKIVQERFRENEYEQLKLRLEKGLPYVREKVLYELLQRDLDIDGIKEKLEYFKIGLNDKTDFFQTAAIEVGYSVERMEMRQEDRILLNIRCVDIIRSVFRDDNYVNVFFDYAGKIIILSNNDNVDMTECCEVIKTQVINKCKCNISIGIGNKLQGLRNICVSYKEADDALQYKVVIGKNQVVSYKDINFATNEESVANPHNNDRLSFNMKAGLKEKTLELIDQMLPESVYTRSNTMERIRLEVFDILLTCQRVLLELGIIAGDLWENNTQPYEDVSRMDNLPELKSYLKNMLSEIIDMINISNEKKTNGKIEQIRKYINSNIQRPDLSLTEIAKEFFISPSHLSRLFKQETAQTIVEYITKVRIERALKLLRDTDLKVYQIGELVGINDPHYFSILFKKNTGSSVNEFRKNQN